MTLGRDGRRATLDAVAGELGLALSPMQSEALIDYLQLLQRWNATYNLTSVRDVDQMLTQHLADCLAVVGPLRSQVGDRMARVLDVGSGAGLPGVVVAVLDPQIQVTCVDAVGKKAAFVQQVAAELRLANLRARHARVEAVDDAPFDVVTARAFATLADLTRLTRRHLAADGVWMAMKGKTPDDEIAALPGDVAVFHVEPVRVPGLAAQRCLVWMRRAAEPALQPAPPSL
jgi:16S rRNA (guanine527-N7)-methyltransferase